MKERTRDRLALLNVIVGCLLILLVLWSIFWENNNLGPIYYYFFGLITFGLPIGVNWYMYFYMKVKPNGDTK